MFPSKISGFVYMFWININFWKYKFIQNTLQWLFPSTPGFPVFFGPLLSAGKLSFLGKLSYGHIYSCLWLNSVDIFEYRDHFGFFCYLVYFQNNLNRLLQERGNTFLQLFLKMAPKWKNFLLAIKYFLKI